MHTHFTSHHNHLLSSAPERHVVVELVQLVAQLAPRLPRHPPRRVQRVLAPAQRAAHVAADAAHLGVAQRHARLRDLLALEVAVEAPVAAVIRDAVVQEASDRRALELIRARAREAEVRIAVRDLLAHERLELQ